MTIEDLQTIDTESPIETDLCIVGSGPAGWAITEGLRGSALRILMLESGGLEFEPDSEALNQIEDVGVPLFNGRNRMLGGTSHTWAGRCVALEDIDYEARPWVPFSGWPFGCEVLAPYLDRASEHLGAGLYRQNGRGSTPDGISKRPNVDPELLRIVSWQFSQDGANYKDSIRLGHLYRARQNAHLRVLVHATVTSLNTSSSGRSIESVEIADPQGKRATVRARAVVLCAGGMENARILLYSDRINPNGVGNDHDVLGRFLIDHPRDPEMIVRFDKCDVARIRDLFGPYKLDSARGQHVFYDGVALSRERQRRDGLLNCAAWPFEIWAADDPVEAVKRLIAGPRTHAIRDAASVISHPGIMLRALHGRLARGEAVTHKTDRIGFLATTEQRPDPDSRIRLSGRRDRLGLPIAEVNWRINTQDKDSMAALAKSIASEFQRLGLPAAQLPDWVRDGRHEGVVLVDNCHPAGATRMALDPREGVVDADCQVHGVEKLYVAGSSIFPTNGHANPTLMIVAFALRLADHLKQVLSLAANARPVHAENQMLSAG